MARFILVRHGETEWNRQLRYQGQSDIDLNETGIRQAQELGKRLAAEKIDFIYASDMKRAVKTAEIIASRHNGAGSIQETALLREMDFGDFEGLDWEEMKQRFPDRLTERMAWRNRAADVCAPNGESLSHVAERVKEFIKVLEAHGEDDSILIVAHGGPLQVLLCELLGIGLDHWWQLRLSNAALAILDTHEWGTSLTLFNDVSHLG
ncbi:MAG: alpha-ribazole phosphatase [Dehalococcoidia bacterium]|nr:alpha-ribazole phosphatase [Dehalococcoidia bacterium]